MSATGISYPEPGAEAAAAPSVLCREGSHGAPEPLPEGRAGRSAAPGDAPADLCGIVVLRPGALTSSASGRALSAQPLFRRRILCSRAAGGVHVTPPWGADVSGGPSVSTDSAEVPDGCAAAIPAGGPPASLRGHAATTLSDWAELPLADTRCGPPTTAPDAAARGATRASCVAALSVAPSAETAVPTLFCVACSVAWTAAVGPPARTETSAAGRGTEGSA
jgi:hypothetical protein